MYEFEFVNDYIFMMLYGAVTMLAAVASLYLLFRSHNLFSDVESPLALRRWTAAFMVSMVGSHLWWSQFGRSMLKEELVRRLAAADCLDIVTLVPLAMIVLLRMLQDRRRPVWPIWVSVVPAAVVCIGMGWVAQDRDFEKFVLYYLLVVAVVFFSYLIYSMRQYGRWLRDNYSDLEHKEVWASLLHLALIMVFFYLYSIVGIVDFVEYLVQIGSIALIVFLVWRVETLQQLDEVDVNPVENDWQSAEVPDCGEGVDVVPVEGYRDTDKLGDMSEKIASDKSANDVAGTSFMTNIGTLLKRRCEEPQLYLEYNLSLAKLSSVIGTNRTYLSTYFRQSGTTYNEYINGLRIEHFKTICREALSACQSFSVQEFALKSGFQSYRTFTFTFKKVVGMTAREWAEQERLRECSSSASVVQD